MERSRSKRLNYDSDYDRKTLYFRNKPRYNNSVIGSGRLNYDPSHHRRSSAGGGRAGGTSYMILCQEVKLGCVIGKSGSIIKAIERTGAWVNVHELIPGDEERIIEIFDKPRQNLEGRIPEFYPAQEALFLIHDRIVEMDGRNVNKEFGPWRGGGNGCKVITRLVVPRVHVGSLLGGGGKIIERMKIETNTHIMILATGHNLPRCVATLEEIVQVVGDKNAVKDAIAIISTRLRERQHHYGNQFHNRLHSPQRLFPTNHALIPHTISKARRSSVEGSSLGSIFSAGSKSNITSTRSSGYAFESEPAPIAHHAQSFSGEGIVFRILCPADKVDSVVGESDGIVDLLQNNVGVDVKVADPVAGVEERIVIISSDEGLDDEMFPAQEALLHIQTRIVDLVPGKENIITTRLLLQSDEAEIFQLKDGTLTEMRKITGANIQILPREDVPLGISGSDEILQIVGKIGAAREALVEVTSSVRNYMSQESLKKNLSLPSVSSTSPTKGVAKPEADSSKKLTSLKTHARNGPVISIQQNKPTAEAAQQVKDKRGFRNEIVNQNNSEVHEETPIALNRISVPVVNKRRLEVVIPPKVAFKFVKKSSKELNLISRLSGAEVELIEDVPEVTRNIIRISSGTIEQAERA